jgi:hypothetical protein
MGRLHGFLRFKPHWIGGSVLMLGLVQTPYKQGVFQKRSLHPGRRQFHNIFVINDLQAKPDAGSMVSPIASRGLWVRYPPHPTNNVSQIGLRRVKSH